MSTRLLLIPPYRYITYRYMIHSHPCPMAWPIFARHGMVINTHTFEKPDSCTKHYLLDTISASKEPINNLDTRQVSGICPPTRCALVQRDTRPYAPSLVRAARCGGLRQPWCVARVHASVADRSSWRGRVRWGTVGRSEKTLSRRLRREWCGRCGEKLLFTRLVYLYV